MYLSALTALERKNGKLVILASVAHPASGRDCSRVAAAYNNLVAGTPDGAAKRAKYSHVLFMVDNQVRNQHQFPDPGVITQKAAQAERAAVERRLAEAQDRLDQAILVKEKADAEFEAAHTEADKLGVTTKPTPVVPAKVVTTAPTAAAKPATAAVAEEPPTVFDALNLRLEAERLAKLADEASAAAAAATGKPEEEELIKAAIEADVAAKQAWEAAQQADASAAAESAKPDA